MDVLNAIRDVFPKADADSIVASMEHFGIKNELYFLAQCGHESARFTRFKENLNYSAKALMKVWPSRFDEELANECARNPEKIANIVYSNRLGNGDAESGDGYRYLGRGAIQITGYNNYSIIEDCLISYGICDYRGEVTENPELFEKMPFAIHSACAYWKHNNLDSVNDFKLLTKKINGGLTGYEERVKIKEELEEYL